jgi:hypothetical protein
MHLKVLVSVVPNRHLVMVVSALVWHRSLQVIRQVLYIFSLKLTCLLLQIISRHFLSADCNLDDFWRWREPAGDNIFTRGVSVLQPVWWTYIVYIDVHVDIHAKSSSIYRTYVF